MPNKHAKEPDDWIPTIAFAVFASVLLGLWFAASFPDGACPADEPISKCRREWAMVFAPIIGAVLAIGAAYLAARPVWGQLRIQAREVLQKESDRLCSESEAVDELMEVLDFSLGQMATSIGAAIEHDAPEQLDEAEQRGHAKAVRADFEYFYLRTEPLLKRAMAICERNKHADLADEELSNCRFYYLVMLNDISRNVGPWEATCRAFFGPMMEQIQDGVRHTISDVKPFSAEARNSLRGYLSSIEFYSKHAPDIGDKYMNSLYERQNKILAKIAEYESDLFH